LAEKMDAVVKVKGQEGGTEIQRVPVPNVGQDDVLIKVDVASICGTDVHIYEWNGWAQNRIKPPLLYGHEFAGHVTEIGKNVKNVKVGDYVSGECHIACGTCFNCRTGLMHICENTKIFGVDIPGIFAEYAKIPAMNAWRNDPNLKPEWASIQDPLGNATHCVFRTQVPTRNVVVFGVGPIGMMEVGICKQIGAKQIIAVGRRNKFRTDLAKKMGADFAILSAETDPVKFVKDHTDGRGADVVLENAGDAAGVTTCLRMLRQGGELSLLGVFGENASIDLSKDVVFKYANIYGINGRLMWDTWYRMAGLFRSGLNVDPIITHRFPMSEFEKGMAAMRGGNSGKVVLYPGK